MSLNMSGGSNPSGDAQINNLVGSAQLMVQMQQMKMLQNKAFKSVVSEQQPYEWAPKNEEVVEWSVEKVGDFVRSVGESAAWHNHASTLMENGMDGAVLVSLTMEHIVDDLGINRMFAATLHAAIRRL